MDWPVSAASAAPSGPKTPWLIALLRNRTLATSIGISASGTSPASTKAPAAFPNASVIPERIAVSYTHLTLPTKA